MSNKSIRAENQIVIFLHIPKTAGTSLRNIIEKNFNKREIFNIDGKNPRNSTREFNELNIGEKCTFKLIQGHLNFGSIDKIDDKEFKYVTFVRNPIERVLSYYSYILSDKYRRPQAELAEKISLKDYLLSKSDSQMNNHQTRMIAGNVPPEYGVCNEEILERAKKNIIESFTYTGIAENFDYSVLSMSKIFGWKYPFYNKLNITKKRLQLDEIGEDELSLIAEENRFDIKLYNFIISMGEKLYKTPSKFHIKSFQLMNQIIK